MQRRSIHQPQAGAVPEPGRTPGRMAHPDADEPPPPQINDLDVPCGQREQKRFENARAVCMRRGFELHRAQGFILVHHRDQRFFLSLDEVMAWFGDPAIQEAE
jgi:hypothetical protein